MSIPMKCPNGHVFMSSAYDVQNGSNNTFIDNSEPCIVCGALAYNLNGTYSHAGGQITSVANMQPEDKRLLTLLLAAIKATATNKPASQELRTIIKKAEGGFLDDTQTEVAFARVNSDLAEFYSGARRNNWDMQIIFTIINLLITIYALYDSNQTSAQAHSDALKSHELISKQSEIERDQNQIIQRLHESLLVHRKIQEQKAISSRPKSKLKPTNPQQKQRLNRHERRKETTVLKKKR